MDCVQANVSRRDETKRKGRTHPKIGVQVGNEKSKSGGVVGIGLRVRCRLDEVDVAGRRDVRQFRAFQCLPQGLKKLDLLRNVRSALRAHDT